MFILRDFLAVQLPLARLRLPVTLFLKIFLWLSKILRDRYCGQRNFGSAIGGTPQFQSTGITVDTQGNLYTTGYFSDGYGSGTATFGNITLTFITETTGNV